jgi:hypothetical protein
MAMSLSQSNEFNLLQPPVLHPPLEHPATAATGVVPLAAVGAVRWVPHPPVAQDLHDILLYC